MKFGIIVFPGSNCDHDCFRAIQTVTGHGVQFLWHKDKDLKDSDVVIVPGGFSYGDYLRAGAIARYSPIMGVLVEQAKKGLPVLGICNGFQILTEVGLLPGTLMRNQGLKFVCKTISVRLENTDSIFTKKGTRGGIYQLPVAHGDGNYFLEDEDLKTLEDNEQVVFRYVNGNPNGSVHDIAGVKNKAGNVVGLMPHPERVCEAVLGGTDGRFFFESVMEITNS